MTSSTRIQSLTATPDQLTVDWAGGDVSHYPAVWLRDNAPTDRHPHNGQRLVDIADAPAAPSIAAAVEVDGVVRVDWAGEARRDAYAPDWLARHARPMCVERPELAPHLWLDGAQRDAAKDFAWSSLAAVRGEPATRLAWLTRLLQDGLAFLTGVGSDESAILEATAPFGRIAETNYGQVFDVRFLAQPENLADSDVGLGLHTDNPYREPVPGFQALHVLVASPDGGASLFADGFAVAEHLRATQPEAFARIVETPVPFLYQSKDADLYAERPLIALDCRGEIRAVHYNNRSIAPLRLPAADVGPFYVAYRAFAQLLREPRFQLRLTLRDGELVLFDNQRTLHGRTAFSSARHPRHLRGCYLTRDSVYSTTARLRRGLAAGD